MPHKILLIDDERVNSSLLRFRLGGEGYQMFSAEDGDAGLERIKTDKPDLIILDVQMPKMNGYEFMGELKRIQGFETTPVIMLTANETMEDVFRLEGVKAYFVKPVNMSLLLEKIRAILGPQPESKM